MRIGEAVRLDRADVSLAEGLITIRDSKFGKFRHILAHPTTAEALGSYLHRRAELSPCPESPAFFVHPAGNRVTYISICQMFHHLVRRAGIEPRSEHCRPTIHGLRHLADARVMRPV